MPTNLDALTGQLLAAYCRRWHIRTLSLFGSANRPDFGPDSDLDILVEFEAGHAPGLAFFAMQRELTELLGRPVDLIRRAACRRNFATGSRLRPRCGMSRHN